MSPQTTLPPLGSPWDALSVTRGPASDQPCPGLWGRAQQGREVFPRRATFPRRKTLSCHQRKPHAARYCLTLPSQPARGRSISGGTVMHGAYLHPAELPLAWIWCPSHPTSPSPVSALPACCNVGFPPEQRRCSQEPFSHPERNSIPS